jgi:hypothetical protein
MTLRLLPPPVFLGALFALVFVLGDCACGESPAAWRIHYSPQASFGLREAVAEMGMHLKRAGVGDVKERVLSEAVPCVPGQVQVLALGHAHDATGQEKKSPLKADELSVREERCDGGGRVVLLSGGSQLSGQWAVYEFLRALGIRFFHPEQTHYPPELGWPEESLNIVERPAFARRSLRVHRTHPVELSAPLDLKALDMAGHQKNWIRWNVAHKQSIVTGWDRGLVGDYAFDRGFERETGFNLLNSQQGYRPVLDPDDPRSEAEQIGEAIDVRMAPVEGWPDPTTFGFQFNPSEFTEAPDTVTVERLTFISEYLSENYPGVHQFCINHGTHGEPTENFGVRFFDLPQFAPPELGVRVHTLMFYDLERPAPVYGNENFAHTLAWAREQAEVRPIVHYPESSWWLTFDLPVPLYLAPVTLEARQYDLDLLSDLVTSDAESPNGVVGHDLFTSGQEWGYWLIDYCTARMTWSLGYTHDDCLRDFTGIFNDGDAVYDILKEVEARQIEDMRDPDKIRFLVGSDDETEVAFAAGIVFHPLPPDPASVLNYDDGQIAALQGHLGDLSMMAADYEDWGNRLEALAEEQPKSVRALFEEIHDGIRVFGLRALHAVAIYQAVMDLRAALALGDLDGIDAAYTFLEEARRLTEKARTVVHRREQHYRYPEALTIDGDEPGEDNAVENKTIYPYRYLSRTHRMFYWERPDNQVAALFGEGLELVQVNARILRDGIPLDVNLLVEAVTDLQVDWGDGTQDTVLSPHTFVGHGFYDWVLDATTTGGAIHHEDQAAVVARKVVFEKGRLKVKEPEGAAIIQGLMPGLVLGEGNDGSDYLALGTIEEDEALIAEQGSIQRRDRTGSVSGPQDLTLVLKGVGVINIYEAVMDLQEGNGPEGRLLVITGRMVIQEIVDLLVSVGGFDEEGALELVATILDYTPDTLPEDVDFRIEAFGVEELDP